MHSELQAKFNAMMGFGLGMLALSLACVSYGRDGGTVGMGYGSRRSTVGMGYCSRNYGE